MTQTFVDLETAKAAAEPVLVVSSLVPSPWSEAAKGLFRLARVPVLVVRRGLDTTAIDAWTGVDNVPAVRIGREPVRTNWAAITTLVARLGAGRGGPPLVPEAPAARAAAFGTLHEIAGEDGIGWNARLAMIDAGRTSDGARGFPPPVSKFLGRRYGYTAAEASAARARVAAQLAFLDAQLAAQRAAGHAYFGGAAPSAIDVYVATFLTPVAAPIAEADCPGLSPLLRQAFATAHDALGPLVSPALLAHRAQMFAEHLAWPIAL